MGISIHDSNRQKYEIVTSKTPYQYYNTAYINSVCTLDKEIFKFMLIVKNLWKLLDLNATSKFTSYATNLLVIFYLQHNKYVTTLSSLQPSYKSLNLNTLVLRSMMK